MGIRNIIVTNEGGATSWIHAAKMLIHYDCTTGIEGNFSNKPILSYTPFKEEYDTFWLPIVLSDTSSKRDDLISKIKVYLRDIESFELPSEAKKIFEDEIINTKEYSASLIVEALQRLIEKDNLNISQSSPLPLLKYSFREVCRAKDVLRQFLIKHLLPNDYYVKFPGLEKEEIVSVLNKLKAIESSDLNYEVSKCGTNTFMLKKS